MYSGRSRPDTGVPTVVRCEMESQPKEILTPESLRVLVMTNPYIQDLEREMFERANQVRSNEIYNSDQLWKCLGKELKPPIRMHLELMEGLAQNRECILFHFSKAIDQRSRGVFRGGFCYSGAIARGMSVLALVEIRSGKLFRSYLEVETTIGLQLPFQGKGISF